MFQVFQELVLKTAAELINQFGNLENLLKKTKEIKTEQKEEKH